MFKYELGSHAKDVITGFKGIIMARVQYMTGCNQYGLSPTKVCSDGKKPDWEYFDENRITVSGNPVELPGSKEKKIKGFDGNVPN